MLCADAAPCTTSPSSLERNVTSEMLLPRMQQGLTSLSHIPPLPAIFFPLFLKLSFTLFIRAYSQL